MNKILKKSRIKPISLFASIGLLGVTTCTLSANLPATTFPLGNYNQTVATWLAPTDPNYNQPLVSPEFQRQRMQELYQHLFSTTADAMSPWSANFINAIFAQHPGLPELEATALVQFSNRGKDAAHLNYGENFRQYPLNWIDKLANNMPVNYSSKFVAAQRAIAVKNTAIRILPTNEVSFYSYEIAGEGYPFDNLQASQLWVGTPVYIINYSKDLSWALIASSSTIGWVEMDKLGLVDNKFISRWQKAAQRSLLAITETAAPIYSSPAYAYQFSGYIGTIFPIETMEQTNYKVLIPIRDTNGKAQIQAGLINQQHAEKMPLAATRANFAKLLNSLKNRPYGWGGMYNDNDCSTELESLFRPFGFWLPRHSSNQIYMGKISDETAATPADRIAYLQANGHPLMSIVYIGGHIFLYLGNYPQPSNTTTTEAMTYQNIWGLRPADNSSRAIIGQSLFLPLLLSYPEDSSMVSLAAKSYFQVSNLDEIPATRINMPALFFSSLPSVQPSALPTSGQP